MALLEDNTDSRGSLDINVSSRSMLPVIPGHVLLGILEHTRSKRVPDTLVGKQHWLRNIGRLVNASTLLLIS